MVAVAAILSALMASADLVSGPTLEQLDQYRAKYRTLLDAIAVVESGKNPDAIGDDGKAFGMYQIWEVYWIDAVQFAPVLAGKHEDVFDPQYAERVIIAYWLRYCKSALEEIDFRKLSRVHNGGPRGHRKSRTLPYWIKVNNVLEQQAKEYLSNH